MAHVTVRWGASTLVATHLTLRDGASLLDGTVRVIEEPAGFVLVVLPIADAAEVRVPILPERKQRVFAGPFTVIVDTETDVFAPIGRRVVVGARALASDGASLFVHAAVLLIFMLLRSPLDEHEPIDTQRLASVFAEQGGEDAPADRSGSQGAATGSNVTNNKPEGAAGSGDDTVADLGVPRPGPRGREAVPQIHRDRDALLEDAASFGIISILRSSDARVPSPWDGDAALASGGDASGIAWGNPLGEGLGSGGLGLFGIGEGAGGKGAGVPWGASGTSLGGLGWSSATCGDGPVRCTGTGMGFGHTSGVSGSHITKPPSIRCGGSVGPVKSELERANDGPPSSTLLNRGDRRSCGTAVVGRLPPEVIRRVVRQNFGRMRACYQPERDGEGRVTVSFVIGHDGAVASARGSGEGMRAGMVSCVAKAFQAISFPEPEGGIVTVTYPIVFSPT